MDIVDVVAIGEVAAGEVVKVSALAVKEESEDVAQIRWAYSPERLRLVAILHHLGHLTLKVDNTIGNRDIFADKVDDALGMGFAWVFALEDSLVVFGDHVGRSRDSFRACKTALSRQMR